MLFDSETPLFLHDITDSSFGIVEAGSYRIGYYISRNKEKTHQENEDSLFAKMFIDEITLGIADGAGGHPKGRDASFLIGNEIINDTTGNTLKLIESINTKIIDLKVGARSTLALMKIASGRVRFFCVGDSEIIYWNSHGSEIFSSTPDSSSGLKVRAGVTSQSESLNDPDRYIVNNLMGDEFIRIESTSGFPIKKGHTILLGSDGLFDNLSHEALTNIVGKGLFDKSFEELVALCNEQDNKTWLKNDDIAFILVRKIKV